MPYIELQLKQQNCPSDIEQLVTYADLPVKVSKTKSGLLFTENCSNLLDVLASMYLKAVRMGQLMRRELTCEGLTV